MRYALVIFVLICAACGAGQSIISDANTATPPFPRAASGWYSNEGLQQYGGNATANSTAAEPGNPAWAMFRWQIDDQPYWEWGSAIYSENSEMRLWLGLANWETGVWDWVAWSESVADTTKPDLYYKMEAQSRYLHEGYLYAVILVDQGSANGGIIAGLNTLAH